MTIIDHAKEYIKELFKDDSTGHDYEHTLRVYKTAIELANNHKEVNMFYVELSSLLHDVDDPKLFKTSNNENARKFLISQNVSSIDIENIIQIINEISFSKSKDKKPSTISYY